MSTFWSLKTHLEFIVDAPNKYSSVNAYMHEWEYLHRFSERIQLDGGKWQQWEISHAAKV